MSLPSPVRWLSLGLFLLPWAMGSAGCRRSEASDLPTSTNQSTLPVAPVVQPERGALSNQLEVAGELLPYQEVELHAKVSGYIRNIYVDIGDHVHKGQVLADLEIPELIAQVDEARDGVLRSQQDVLSARSTVARTEADHTALHAGYARLKQAADTRPGLIALQELDDAQAKDSASEAQIEAAKADLSAKQEALGMSKANLQHFSSLADYTHIIAPFSGVVTWRYSDIGALVQAGTSSASAQPVVKLAQTNDLRLRLPVPEGLAGYVRIGDPANISIQATGQHLTGKVVRTTGELDMGTRTLQVEIDLDNTDNKLTPGMYADVTLNIQRTGTGLTVPVQAVNRSGAGPVALVVNPQGRIEKRELRLGVETSTEIEILSGLNAGDRVVTANLSSFTPGEAVRAQVVTLPTFNADGSNGGE